MVRNKRPQSGRAPERRAGRGPIRNAYSIFAGLVVLAGTVWLGIAQQTPTPRLDPATQGPAIIAHLNAAIQFYRSVNQPIQRAGQPNDVIYRDQALSLAAQAAQLAFQSAKAEAAVMQRSGQEAASAATDEQQRIQASQARVEARIKDLQDQEAAIDRKLATASPRNVAALRQQKEQIHAALELSQATQDALHRIVAVSAVSGGAGLSGDVVRLERSVPELQGTTKTAPPQLTTLGSALSAGVTTQGSVLFELLESKHVLDGLIKENEGLRQQAMAVRAPMVGILRGLVQQGQQLSAQTEASLPPPMAAPQPGTKKQAGTRKQAAAQAAQGAPAAPAASDLQSITARFRALAAATVPLSQEVIILEQSRANLAAWAASVDDEYDSLAHALFLRIVVIAIALVVIVGGGELWTRATNKYVRDIRRRRQLLIVRRVVVSFLSILVVLFGFVTRFDSLATFAGFITAGIAVGLQTILLSVAAYFFIIGRYGIKVGDRITIASVTGDVIDVGLVRFYLMELAGTGTSLNSTGRVAVFSNAVLFQAGTPLYKQLPGTGYAWHELMVKLVDGADYRKVCDAILARVQGVYEGYRASIERQHKTVQSWMQASIEPPTIESRLQFSGGAFQLWARFPVEIRQAAETDEKVTQALLELMATNPEMKAAVMGTPTIQPSVRG